MTTLTADQMMLCALGGFFILYGAHAHSKGVRKALKWGWGAGALFVACAFTMAGCMTIESKRSHTMKIAGHRAPTFCNEGQKKAKWKHDLDVALDQRTYGAEGDCLGSAIAHAVACGDPWDITSYGDAQTISQKLDRAINTHEGGHKQSVFKAVWVARDLGYVKDFYIVETFEQYKEAIETCPVILGFDMHKNMLDIDRFGFISPSGGTTGTRHVFCAIGRRKGWLRGRYSVLKQSYGPDWGRFGECKMEDADLERMFRAGQVQAVAIIK